MDGLFGQTVFTVGERTYAWEDVVLAAMWWGDWDRLEAQARQGLACAARLEAVDAESDPDQVSAAADEFRYERDLLTAEETEAWLARWGLTTESWMDYIERAVLRRAWADELDDNVREYPIGDDEVAEAMHAEAVCSGALGRLAGKLAGRAAAFARAGPPAAGAPPAEDEKARAPGALGAVGARAATLGLPGLTPDACAEKLRTIAGLEGAFQRFSQEVLTPKAIHDAINTHHLDWIRLRCRTVTFADEQAANEAALCVREDGDDLTAVARAAKTPVHKTRFYMDEAEPPVRTLLQAARPGEVLGPVPLNGGYALFHVLEKRLPSAEDPHVRRRAERHVLDRAVDHEITHRVRWRFPL
jgi:hypothetical protein